MKKTNDVKPEVVDRAAEIARQLRPKVVQESSDKPSINSLFDISNQKAKNVAADGAGGGQVGSKEGANMDVGNTNTIGEKIIPDVAHEERTKEWKSNLSSIRNFSNAPENQKRTKKPKS